MSMTEGPNLDLDVADGLSDNPESDLSNDAEIVELSNLQCVCTARGTTACHSAGEGEGKRKKENLPRKLKNDTLPLQEGMQRIGVTRFS